MRYVRLSTDRKTWQGMGVGTECLGSAQQGSSRAEGEDRGEFTLMLTQQRSSGGSAGEGAFVLIWV